jgi:hypothetical protein
MQSEQLAYAIVTPYSMRKSRTGGIVGRLISRTGLDLVGGRMFAPGAELTKRYADTIVTETDPSHRATQQLIREYVLKNFTGEKNGQHARVLFLIFRGPELRKRFITSWVTSCTSAPAAKRFVTPTVITSPMIQRMLFTSSREWSLNSNRARSSAI